MMNSEHVISEEAMKSIQSALHKNELWMAYNTMCYFLDDRSICFFRKNDEAEEFAAANISDYDSFNIIKISSLEDALKQLHTGEILNNNLITNKILVMNEKNYEYLKDQLLRTGFGDTLNEELRKNIEQKNLEFTLALQSNYGSDKVNATLHFKRSDESDMVFFNKYDLELRKDNNDIQRQTFYPNKSITLKEGYNLLDGRAVHKTLTNKEGEKYQAWLQLDFKNNTQSGNYQLKQYHHNYGFDLEKTLSKYPIKELENEKYKDNLIRSLERGNLQSATFLINGKEEKIFLTPNVAFKALSAFDANMNKIKLSDVLENQKHEQSNKQDTSQKQTAKSETKITGGNEKPMQKKSRKQKVT